MHSRISLLTLGVLAAGLMIGLVVQQAGSEDNPAESAARRLVQAAERVAEKANQPPADAPLIVHEWGTFTSFSGSDGIKLEFRPLVENDLPGFVFNRARQNGHWFGKFNISALQRMETPVTYFYTPIERDVSVRVEFPEGLLTEFYPPVQRLAPEFSPEQEAGFAAFLEPSERPEPVELKNSMLDWGTVHLIPLDSLRAHVGDPELSRRIGKHVERTMTPNAYSFTHYAAARETDSAIVQVRHLNKDGEERKPIPEADYFEKFLFYRGVGNFDLPIKLQATGDRTYELTNSGDDEIRSLFLVTVRGEDIHFSQYDGVNGQSSLTLQQSEQPATLDQLSEAVAQALRAEGLYEKEAWAMVNTWKQSWFGEEGTRLFYTLPARITDELLPLHIDPQPDEIVRVLVGRMEIMAPEDERHVLDLISRSAAARDAAQESFRSPVMEDLLAMGRLAEPALVRAKNVTDDPQMQSEAARLLWELRAEYEQQNAG